MTKQQFRKIIGENIRSERLARNMSIDELAELLELTAGFVGLIERGRRGATAYNIHRIADIFGLGVEKFYARPGGAKVTISEDVTINNKHRRMMTLAYDLSEKELDFLLTTLKGLRQLRVCDPAAGKRGETE